MCIIWSVVTDSIICDPIKQQALYLKIVLFYKEIFWHL